MENKQNTRKFTRRDILKLGGQGALTLLAGGALAASARRLGSALAAPGAGSSRSALAGVREAPAAAPVRQGSPVHIRLAATDGYILLPGRADPLYVFGFIEADPNASVNSLIGQLKGQVQAPAPWLGVDQEDDVYMTMTNLGLVVRPDLDDSHTIHWHGFRNPVAVFDGVPEVSISVPVARDFPYFFKPHDPGTYMYHCHFEDVEHVQMGMNGIIFVRPAQNGTAGFPGKYVYNDGDGSTEYDREYTLMLNEVDTRPHDLLEAVQEFIWSSYKANYWIINGRCYPDTIKPNNDPALPHQPVSSLIQANEGDRVLLRFANLGYEQHDMQLQGIPMKVVGHDASYLGGPSQPPDLTYWTHTIYIGPGEARDVIFTAPAFDPSGPVASDGRGDYNAYLLKNRNLHKLNNGGAPGLGGMMTEVRIYQDPLPAQTTPNEIF